MQKTFVLVHGAWAGQDTWSEVRPLLAQAGHRVITFDLPGHGNDPNPPDALTLADYVAATARQVAAAPGPVVLVGHSMAGMIISQVAENLPGRVAQLVYVCAYLPRDGQRAFDFADPTSQLPSNLVFSADQRTATVRPAAIVPLFVADCPPAIQARVLARHRPEALGPFQERVALTAAGFGQVPKLYLETLRDIGISTTLQRQMLAANGPVARVVTLDSGHCPHLARPHEVAAALLADCETV